MKIAQVLLSPRIGGAETLVATLEHEWSQSGHVESHTLYLDDDRPRSRLARVRHLRRALREGGFDAIVAHSALPMVYARTCAPLGVPVVGVIHSQGLEYDGRGLRLAEQLTSLRPRSAIVAVSTSSLHAYQAHVRRRRRSETAVIPNPVRSVGSARTDVGNRFTIVTVARFAQVKHPRLWIDTARAARDAGLPVRFEWWGPAENAEWAQPLLKEIADEAGLMAWCGATDDVSSVYASAHVLLHTSLREAQGITLYEAAIAGLPVVHRSSLEGVDPRVVSRTFDGDDPAAAAEALRSVIISWPELRALAGSRAPDLREVYAPARCASEYAEVLRRLIRDKV